ncbi:MAG: ABC transporter ATP-binding protein [Bacteroidota bacterium]
MTEITSGLPEYPLRRFWRLIGAERRDITFLYIYAVLAGLISLSLPLGIQAIVNFVAGGQLTTSWGVLVFLVILGVALNGVLQIMQLSITEIIQQRIFTNSAFEFAFRVPRMRLESLYRHYAPELVNRFFDTLNVQKGLSKILIDLSSSTLQVIFGLALLSFYHPLFILFGIALVILLYMIIRYTGPMGFRTSLQESKYKYQVVHWLEELARSMEVFKMAGPPDLPMVRTDGLVVSYLDSRKRHFRVLLTKYGFMVAFKVLIIAALLIIGSVLVVQNEMNIGQFVAAEIVIILLINSVEKLILSVETVYDVLTALEKIGYVMDIPLEQPNAKKFVPVEDGRGLAIHIADLHFGLPDSAEILAGVNLEVAAGEKLCISGKSEPGKALLLRLLAGFYQDYTGAVTVNGMPLRNLDLCNLRGHIGGFTSLQSVFDGTLLENITLGRGSCSLDEVLRIIKVVGLQNYIDNEPLGFEKRITPEEAKLPQSAYRKILLARALASKPRLLLLNEPFIGLTQGERDQLRKFITESMPHATVIMTLDEPDSAQGFDRVVEMKNGTIDSPNKS